MSAASPDIAVVIVAAGRGERAGSGEAPKQYRRVGDRAVIKHTLDVFTSHTGVGRIIVAIHADDESLFRHSIGEAPGIRFVHGGASRQVSTFRALRALAADPPAVVLIHDAVRPFLSHDVIDRVVAMARTGVGALPATAIADTLKRSEPDGSIAGTVARDGLFAAQTPQGFPFAAILAAHEKAAVAARSACTDDCAVAEWAGLSVRLVPGSADNVKLTWPADLASADQRLSRATVFPDVRTGNGYDVHPFEPGDHVMLCGVAIPHDRKLSGHSDADVALHALTDALLATCGAGDIGTHFPPSDPQWKGAASHNFVEHAAALVRRAGGRIASADITLIAEAPRIGPHREAMTAELAGMLRIRRDRVSVKATTNEQLGFIGRGEGIAAMATATVVYPGELEP